MNLIELVVSVAQQNKYPLLFVIYLIEGPISGFISALIASKGGLNIFIIFLLLIVGEIGADVIYYYIGKNSSESGLNRILSKHEKRGVLKVIRETFNRSPVKALIFVKSVMFISVPSILLIGRFQSMKRGKFILWTVIVCLVKDISVLFLGYGLGISLEAFLDGYDIYRIIAIIITLLIIGYVLYRAYKERVYRFIIKTLKNIR